MANEYTLGGPPPQSRSEKILMNQNPGPAQSRIEELLKNSSSGRTAGALVYKGTVETALSLPSSGNEVGDVYHVNSDGSEWAWNGSMWEELGKSVATDAVLYTPQSLTPAQQAQARSNIDAAKLFVVRIASESDPLTANKTIASFPDGADDAPVKSLVAQIAPVQSGSGDPSPTNIRPISGWTSATVTRTGADNQSDTYTIAFPAEAGTVYGGTLDVANGVLTVDSAIVDMGTLNWMYYSAQQRMVAQINRAKPAAANVGLDGACSVYKVVNTGYRLAPDKSIVISNNFISNQYGAMVVYDSDYTDAETFKTAVSGQTLVFPIKNPDTYQLDPVTVTTLLGVNNIWADTGDVAVDYRADTSLYIQKLTEGYQTAAQVQTAIAAAAELPTGGSTGDFLRKTSSGVAWETVPAAESNSFGGA